MRRPFLGESRESPTERVLRASRPKPSEDFEDTLTRRTQRTQRRGRALRPLVASGITVAIMLTGAAASLAAVGGKEALSAAAYAIADLVPRINTDNGADKVAICHATGSDTNPFVLIKPSAAGVFNGHLATSSGGNAGADHQGAEDIIPPFEYKGQTYSQNWNAAGMAIFEADCKVLPQYINPLNPLG